jgi:cytochrome P450 family 142 subfamily A polypeptide 1
MMIDMDAPEHQRRRRLVSEGFTPKRVRAGEGWLRQICDGILDRVCEQGECDFVRDIAAPLPLIAIGDLLGVHAEARDDLLRWSDDMLKGQGSPDPAAMERAATAFVEYVEYITGVVEQRRLSGKDDDLIGTLVHAEIDGDRLNEDSLIHESLLILIGGDETTRHVISGGMAELLRNPDQFDRLREDPSGLPTAVEEMLRWVSPIKNMARAATRDVELHGQKIRKDEKLLLLYPAANRDEAVFDRPEEFDIQRSPNDHVAFGFGSHFCLGNQLARLELRVMFSRLLDRMPDMAFSGGDELALRQANFVSGIEKMPVVFTPGPKVEASA